MPQQSRWGEDHLYTAITSSGHVATGPAEPQIHKQEPFHLFVLLMTKGWGKDHRKSEYGNKREFLHEPMSIPHTVFHSPQNTPSSCLIKWHLVSIFAWLFSSRHHWEESNLSNWYREFFPAWLKEQNLYWDSFMAVAVISFRNHGKGT